MNTKRMRMMKTKSQKRNQPRKRNVIKKIAMNMQRKTRPTKRDPKTERTRNILERMNRMMIRRKDNRKRNEALQSILI